MIFNRMGLANHRRPLARRGFVWVLLAAFILVFASPLALAQTGYPQATDLFVNDYAQLLTAEEEAQVRALFADLKQDTGIEAVAVTINSINDYNTADQTIEDFATHLFNTWGIGNSQRNDGVLLLVAIRDRTVRIEVGSGYGVSQNDQMQEVINEHIIPSFKRDNYGQGIYRGARAIVGNLTGEWPPEPSSEGRSVQPNKPAERVAAASETTRVSGLDRQRPAAISSGVDINPIVLIGGFVALLGGTGLGLRRYLRYRKRRCPDCQQQMVRLGEKADDVYLDSGQQLEEFLSTVDYDIWKCPSCNNHTLRGYRNWFTSFKGCPRCNYRTLKVTDETLVSPTYSSTGKKRITSDCRHCDYHHTETVVLPMKTRSDDSGSSFGGSSSHSSGSFGGGHSSGGGASGKW